MSGQGIVYLVGAGPGDPKLLTLRALELIRSAEVIAHDELVPPEILSLVPADTELLAVGRRHGSGKTDYRLHPLVIERALAGRIVVRLKCGDPFIFGRGAEEAEELAEAGIPFEIVPGVSAALGAAAFAGIPLTDRRHASRVVLTTGHRADGGGHARETVVLYMAGHRLKQNIDQLIQDGHQPSTPAAYIAAATTPRQVVITGTLEDLAERIGTGRSSEPALVIVGEATRLRERIGWFEKAPLHGRCVMVARARPGPSQIAARLRALGALVIERPKVSIEIANDYSPLEQALRKIDKYHGIVFGCSVGVRAVANLLRPGGATLSPKLNVPAIAIGREIAEVLEQAGISPVLRLDGSCRGAIAKAAPALAGKRLLLVASGKGRPSLVSELEAAGASVETIPAYSLSYDRDYRPEHSPDLIVLPSSSAVRLLLENGHGSSLANVPMVAMGPVTEAVARAIGAVNVKRCPADSIDSIVATVTEMLGGVAAAVQDGNGRTMERADAAE
jgi:uroporphyrinogen III methyltransferase/synthase